MSDEALEQALRELALKLLAQRDHSAHQLRVKLRQKTQKQRDRFPEGNIAQAIEAVIADLTSKHYLDDRRFAAALARRRQSSRHHGVLRIRRDLKQRGIDGKIADSALLELPDSAAAMEAALRSYIARRGEPSRIEDLQPIYRFLVRLGHAPSEVRRHLSPFFKKVKSRSGRRNAT